MKHLMIFLSIFVTVTLADSRFVDAFDPNRHASCAKAKALVDAMPNIKERTGCNCEIVDYDGWRCIVYYSLDDANQSNGAH